MECASSMVRRGPLESVTAHLKDKFGGSCSVELLSSWHEYNRGDKGKHGEHTARCLGLIKENASGATYVQYRWDTFDMG